jgi:hypothetical protein
LGDREHREGSHCRRGWQLDFYRDRLSIARQILAINGLQGFEFGAAVAGTCTT